MFRNYFKIAVRNLLKRKAFTAINIMGLAIGMAVCLLIVLFIQDEVNYDKHHERGDNIYRVVLDRKYPGRSSSYANIPQAIGAAIKNEYPEVLESTRIFNVTGGGGNFFLRINDKTFEERHVLAVDSNFFKVFSAKFIAGDATTPLAQSRSVVLPEATAKRYYGSAQAAVDKTFEVRGANNNITTYKIAAVIKDWPENSHFLFDMLLSTAGEPFANTFNYINFEVHNYLLVQPGTSPASLEARFPQLLKKYVAGPVQQVFGQSFEDFQKNGNGYRYYLQPLRKIHLVSDLESELRPNGSLTAVYIFSVVAIFILFLACINFVNLSTARSVERAREVGIRKTFGSARKSLILQFLFESVLISFISILVAFALIGMLLPLFNQVANKTLTLSWYLQPLTLAVLLAFSILIGIIAGLYPAFVLSSFKPILVLKGRFKSQKYGLLLRNGLVVFQFAISVILIVCTIMVNRQMNYMMGEKIGFRKDHVIMIERTDMIAEQTQAFKNDLAAIAGVESVSGTTSMPGQENFYGITYTPVGSKEQVTGRGLMVDDTYAKVLGLELAAGRFFSKAYSTDSFAVVLNEKAVQEYGLKNPIGAKLVSRDNFLNNPDGSEIQYTVIGVVKDFHYQSLHQQINPLIFNNIDRFGGVANTTAVRIKSADFIAAITAIENTWKKFIKQRPFHYTFLDQALEQQYNAEQTTQKIFTIFSSLAIFIACIGLLGLAAYATQQRTKEIGIRKVLGAGTGTIVAMLSKDFLKLVLIASLLAFPVAWWGMHKWLQEFAYRISLSAWVFIVALAAALFVALCTISFQAIKAAMTNPVKSLRSE